MNSDEIEQSSGEQPDEGERQRWEEPTVSERPAEDAGQVDAEPQPPSSTDEPQPTLPQTGDPRVDEALEHLTAVQDLPPAEQLEVYIGTHRALQDRLADLED